MTPGTSHPPPRDERNDLERVRSGTVVVTGICGRFGRRIARALHRQRRIVGLDPRPFLDRPKDVEHAQFDPRSKRAREVFRQPDVGAVIHLAITHNPRNSAEDQHVANVLGFQKVLEYAAAYRIPKLVLLSSANVYGPRPDNAQFLDEDAPLLATGRFSEMRDLVEIDMSAQSFFWKHPETETVILRPAHILGTVKNAPSNYLRLARVPTLLGYDPMMQVVHQDDVIQAVMLALAPGARGIFNLAGPGPVPLSQAVHILGRTSLAVPHGVAKFAVDRLFRWRVTSFPAPELDFIRYVCMVDDSRAKTELGYAPRADLAATLRAVDEERWV
jgi:UDP-glucose 4-epimerase